MKNQEPRLRHQQFLNSLNLMMKRQGIQVIEPSNIVESPRKSGKKNKGILTKNQLSAIAEGDEYSSGEDETARQLGNGEIIQGETAPVAAVVGELADLVANVGPDIYQNESKASDSESC